MKTHQNKGLTAALPIIAHDAFPYHDAEDMEEFIQSNVDEGFEDD